MQTTKTNYEMKLHNFQSVFKTIQRYSNISRRELQNLTDLSWGSVSAITADMLASGLILEKSHKLGYSGRTPKLLTVNPAKNRVLGIDVNTATITFALCDLGGRVLQSETVFPQKLNKSYFLSTIDTYCDKYFAQFNEIIMIAFSVQGQTDSTNSVSLSIEKIEDWANVPLKAMYAEKYGVPVYLFHDPDCLLMHTLTKMSSLTDVKNCITLRLSTNGIGVAAMLNGVMYSGANNEGIEIEHTTLVPGGMRCKCGKQGCLYAYCTLDSLQKQYKDDGPDFLTALAQEEPNETVARLFGGYANALSITVQNLLMLFNPEYLFINGEMTKYKNLFEKEFYLKLNKKYHNRVFINAFDSEFPAVGATLFAIDKRLTEILFP